ncbi:hypothetical protein Purlil1_7593 [Purpureocillium lilacinum]|uniref:Inosine/uridine-preferring nucleoside hydrolase domain-containing protein n=2 Tax=Purpureocillium lilacinum TaxID=33203 RepID=A0ABR0BVP4_PURLI|nr:hypothetical protein Purlil1_7593 [Purpureocillium lilacinum]
MASRWLPSGFQGGQGRPPAPNVRSIHLTPRALPSLRTPEAPGGAGTHSRCLGWAGGVPSSPDLLGAKPRSLHHPWRGGKPTSKRAGGRLFHSIVPVPDSHPITHQAPFTHSPTSYPTIAGARSSRDHLLKDANVPPDKDDGFCSPRETTNPVAPQDQNPYSVDSSEEEAAMTISQIPVWLDCDPGHDDVFAILLAAYHPRIKLLGISTVFGNASLEHTTHNAASVLTALGKHLDIPLHVGLGKALERPALHAPTDIHGDSGLDGTELLPPPRCSPSPVPAVDAMATALRLQPPGTAWIVATGALTNVGALFRAHPDLAAHIRGLSLMGGSFGGGFSDAPMGKVDNAERIGNVTPWAEFNILVDPEAAADVFHNPAIASKTTVVPLDLSHQVLATDDVHRLLLYGDKAAPGSGVATEPGAGPAPAPGKSTLRTMLVELLYFFAKTYSDVFGITEGPPLHDPIAVAAVLTGTDDEIPFTEWEEGKSTPPRHAERFDVRVVTEGTFEEAKLGLKQTGRTIATPLPPGSEGVRIPRGMDVAKFWKVIEECIQRADTVNEGLKQ